MSSSLALVKSLNLNLRRLPLHTLTGYRSPSTDTDLDPQMQQLLASPALRGIRYQIIQTCCCQDFDRSTGDREMMRLRLSRVIGLSWRNATR